MMKHPNVVSEPDQIPKWEPYPRFETEVSDQHPSEHSSSKISQKQKGGFLQPTMAHSPSQKSKVYYYSSNLQRAEEVNCYESPSQFFACS